jgi:hypothetical protein
MYDENALTYVKSPQGYSVERLGDKVGGLISSDTTSDFTTCIDKCSATEDCVGISYKEGVCDLKKSEGMASSYSQTSKQFILNNNPKASPSSTVVTERLPSGIYSIRSANPESGNCGDFGGGGVDCSDPNRGVGSFEQFTIDPLGAGKYSIKSGKSGWVCGDFGTTWDCNDANRGIGSFETFNIQHVSGNEYTIDSDRTGGGMCGVFGGKIDCSDPGRGRSVNETFTITRL